MPDVLLAFGGFVIKTLCGVGARDGSVVGDFLNHTHSSDNNIK